RLVRLADVQADIRIGVEKVRKAGQQEMSRLGAMHVDPHQTGRLDAGEPGFGIFEIGNQVHTAPIIGLSIESGLTPSRASSPLTASVTELRGRPRSSAAPVKLLRSTIRVKTRIASNRSMLTPLFAASDSEAGL